MEAIVADVAQLRIQAAPLSRATAGWSRPGCSIPGHGNLV
jgi:hypothetical protein